MNRALAVVAVFAGACGQAQWSAPEQNLDRIVLSAWGSSGSDVWFAGGGLGSGPGALVLHFDGAQFVEHPTGASQTLWWVFGRSPSSVWFVGEKGLALRWNGQSFATVPTPTQETLYGAWGASDDDVWAVGGTPDSSSTALHFDGNAWSAANLPSMGGAYFKVWGAARDCVYAVGQGGTILHFDGSAWTRMANPAGANTPLVTVAGRACDDVYAVGGAANGVALHFDGAAWSPVAGLALDNANGLAALAVDASGDVAIGGLGGDKFRFHAGAWADDSLLDPRGSDFHGAWLDGAEDIFLVGGNFVAPPGAPRQGIIARYAR